MQIQIYFLISILNVNAENLTQVARYLIRASFHLEVAAK